ncbi:ABC transporter ATP-binding protein/permease [Amorphus orientalis]|uniref:ABC transport system ATP-binding protein n=1 Tax=Amorphus orientalis TaxID=649198 RepID=A0AAE3VRH4_9HYPH|nr:ABC transporter ATP-binding protein/permease [Amorphus orientalis]MDQ0316999.1 putative ABC transport system ATP-binding protein [Amorphus orientalis]
MQKSLFGFIWAYSKRQQLTILAITVVSFPILYMTLELPKWIVNDAIDGSDFPRTIAGYQLDQIPYLMALCGIFLGLVVLNNVVKFVLNVYKGIVGERMLRRLRYKLYNQILRFRLPQFRGVSAGELISMMIAEVEDLGVFIGDAIATPAFQGGTLIVYIVFIFAQDPLLGAAAVLLYPVQGYIIPKLQQKVVILVRERVKNVRKISDKVGESVAGVTEIHANDTAQWHLADITDKLLTNYRIRLEIYKRKYMIKFINNFMNQLPPFFFYSVGGYLVIIGDLSFGALVAVLAAYKDLAGPWKELITYYQNLSNMNVKYETVVENFDPPNMYPAGRLEADGEPDVKLDGAIAFSNVSAVFGSGQEVADFDATIEGQVAVFGTGSSGRTEVLLLAAGLMDPQSGRVEIGGRDLSDLPESVLGREIGYVGAAPYMFNDTIRGNVIYSLRHRPIGDAEVDDDEHKFRISEAGLTGNSKYDFDAPWVDLTEAGVEDVGDLDQHVLDLFERTGLGNDLVRMGLQSNVDPNEVPDLADRVLEARKAVRERIRSDEKLQDLVELWRIDAFNPSGTLAENVMFALPTDPAEPIEAAAHDPDVIAALTEADVHDDLVEIGAKVAETMIELFSEMAVDDSLMGDFSLLSSDQLPAFEPYVRAFHNGGVSALSADQSAELVGLAFRLIPARHRLTEIGEDQAARFVKGRQTVCERLAKLDGRYTIFDEERYIDPLTVEENILFGKPRVDRRGARERIEGFIRDTLTELQARDPIARAGLNYQVGVGGSRLSPVQRRRVGLVRALIKRPKILMLDGTIDEEPRLADEVRSVVGEGMLLVGTGSQQVARRFDRVLVLKDGRLVADGEYASVRSSMSDDDDDDDDGDTEPDAGNEAAAEAEEAKEETS